MKFFLFFLLISSSLVVLSCKEKDNIVFNKSDEEALDIEHKWAIVKDPYVACRETPAYDSKITKNLRKNALEVIIGEKTVKIVDGDNEKYEKWIAFKDGWVPETSVDVFLNKLRAEKSLKEN